MGVVGLESVEVRLKMCSNPRPSAPSFPSLAYRENSPGWLNRPQAPVVQARLEIHSKGKEAFGPLGSSVQLFGMSSSTVWSPTGVDGRESVDVLLKICSIAAAVRAVWSKAGV